MKKYKQTQWQQWGPEGILLSRGNRQFCGIVINQFLKNCNALQASHVLNSKDWFNELAHSTDKIIEQDYV